MESSNNAVALVNPQGNMEKAMGLVRLINARRDEVLSEIEAVSAKVTPDNYKDAAIAEEVKRLKDVVEDLREHGKRLVADVCAATEAQRVLTAIDSRLWNYSTKCDPASAYGKISAAYKSLTAKIAEFKDAATPKMPTRACAVVLYATDKAIADLCKKIQDGKLTGVEGYRFAPDEATEKKIVKIVEGK